MAAYVEPKMADDQDVMEGFLCPVCLQDLTSIAQLQVHFEEKHATEDKAVLNSLKSIFSKAKKFLNDSDSEEEATGSSSANDSKTASTNIFSNIFSSNSNVSEVSQNNNPWNWHLMQKGPKKNHSALYKNIRSDRIDAYVAETNKLLLRLDKLLTDIPSDPVKRKAQERLLVPWVDDACVPLCPDCGKAFNTLTRRRHHCRLCGAIMCHNCSLFLSMAFAKKLVAPVHVATSMSGGGPSDVRLTASHMRGGSAGKGDGGGFSLRRSGSQGSLNSLVSIMDQLTGEQHLRVCKHCHQRVSARNRAVQQRQQQPLLSLLYTKLMTDRATLERLLPRYINMAQSLWSGESVYNLSDAAELRMKLLRLGDSINATSQKIKTLGPVLTQEQQELETPDESTPLGPRQALLQKRIHQSTAAFLKTHVLGLDKLPEASQLLTLQVERREAAAQRLAEERRAAEIAELKAEQALQKLKQRDSEHSTPKNTRERSLHCTPSHRASPLPASVGDEGWGGDKDAHVVTSTDDPVVQQMNIIRNYIRQARDACRYDEVATLERNLKELQTEYRRIHS